MYQHVTRLQSVGSPTHMEDSNVQALVRRQLAQEYQQESGPVRGTSGTIDPSHRTTGSSQGGTTSSQETTGNSVGTGSSRRGHSRGSKRSEGVAVTDTPLSIMPRRSELPSSHLVNRVFKVIFLGEKDSTNCSYSGSGLVHRAVRGRSTPEL